MIDNTKLKKVPKEDKLEAEKKLQFLEEYKKLVEKHGYDFMQGEVHIIKVEKIK